MRAENELSLSLSLVSRARVCVYVRLHRLRSNAFAKFAAFLFPPFPLSLGGKRERDGSLCHCIWCRNFGLKLDFSLTQFESKVPFALSLYRCHLIYIYSELKRMSGWESVGTTFLQEGFAGEIHDARKEKSYENISAGERRCAAIAGKYTRPRCCRGDCDHKCM